MMYNYWFVIWHVYSSYLYGINYVDIMYNYWLVIWCAIFHVYHLQLCIMVVRCLFLGVLLNLETSTLFEFCHTWRCLAHRFCKYVSCDSSEVWNHWANFCHFTFNATCIVVFPDKPKAHRSPRISQPNRMVACTSYKILVHPATARVSSVLTLTVSWLRLHSNMLINLI